MSKDAAEKAKAPTPGKAQAPAPKPKPRNDGKDFGDACVGLKIKEVNHVTTDENKEHTKLTLIVPPVGRVVANNQGYIQGMPFATVELLAIQGSVATAVIYKRVEASALEGRSVIMSCPVPTVGVITGKVVRRRDKDGNLIVRSEAGKTILEVDIGSLHGVKDGMVGHVKGYPALSFKLERGRVRDTFSEVFLEGLSGGPYEVEIYKDPSNKK